MERGDNKAPGPRSLADDAQRRTRPGALPGAFGPAPPSDAAPLEQAHRICPGCGAAMVDRSCKLRCLRCGFFLDCSDG